MGRNSFVSRRPVCLADRPVVRSALTCRRRLLRCVGVGQVYRSELLKEQSREIEVLRLGPREQRLRAAKTMQDQVRKVVDEGDQDRSSRSPLLGAALGGGTRQNPCKIR